MLLFVLILEHVYDPFVAINNIYSVRMMEYFGYIPFLYHYHAPDNLYFQDYYRYTKDGLAYLLKDFKT